MKNNETILRVENIHKSFGDLAVLKGGVSFDVKRGETICFIGPSGTGKSTLLRCINLLIQPDQVRYGSGMQKSRIQVRISIISGRKLAWSSRTSFSSTT